ncbi:MAG: SBBP repeat-containing protein [Deltaproteobacteria bacterium]|nr:SBBP repeat-containing protein [Deltaproteobacteria bacterium]
MQKNNFQVYQTPCQRPTVYKAILLGIVRRLLYLRVWIKQFGTSKDDIGYSPDSDDKGNIYIAGTTSGTFENHENSGGFDACLIKFNQNGDMIWVKQWGTKADDELHTIVVNSDYIYVTTQSYLALTKYSTDGALQWDRKADLDTTYRSYGITIDAIGAIVVSGFTADKIYKISGTSLLNAFILKYSPEGELQ